MKKALLGTILMIVIVSAFSFSFKAARAQSADLNDTTKQTLIKQLIDQIIALEIKIIAELQRQITIILQSRGVVVNPGSSGSSGGGGGGGGGGSSSGSNDSGSGGSS